MGSVMCSTWGGSRATCKCHTNHKKLSETNTLAYLTLPSVTKKKSFIALTTSQHKEKVQPGFFLPSDLQHASTECLFFKGFAISLILSQKTCALYHKSFAVVIYDRNASMIVFYYRNVRGQCYKAMILASSRIFTHLATLFHLATMQWLRAQTLAPLVRLPLGHTGIKYLWRKPISLCILRYIYTSDFKVRFCNLKYCLNFWNQIRLQCSVHFQRSTQVYRLKKRNLKTQFKNALKSYV
jgi:hypothetical protein